jgi:hypothetical protein
MECLQGSGISHLCLHMHMQRIHFLTFIHYILNRNFIQTIRVQRGPQGSTLSEFPCRGLGIYHSNLYGLSGGLRVQRAAQSILTGQDCLGGPSQPVNYSDMRPELSVNVNLIVRRRLTGEEKFRKRKAHSVCQMLGHGARRKQSIEHKSSPRMPRKETESKVPVCLNLLPGVRELGLYVFALWLAPV